jgi:2-oxoglutarate ferredoxin oxidoreductase subunit beta
LSNLDGVTYLERVAVSSPKDVVKTKKVIRKAFENQIAGRGFSLVEVLSMCPTAWKQTPTQAVDFVNNQMKNVFPLGVFKDKDGQ